MMVERTRIRLRTGVLACVLLPALTGCVDAPYDQAGYPQSYDYYYYPGDDVYYHPYSGWYHYQDHGQWLRARQLPPSRTLDWQQRRLLIIREPEPWRRHDEHRRDYATPKPSPSKEAPAVAPKPKPPSAVERDRRQRPPERSGSRPDSGPRHSEMRKQPDGPRPEMRRSERRDASPGRRESGSGRDGRGGGKDRGDDGD